MAKSYLVVGWHEPDQRRHALTASSWVDATRVKEQMERAGYLDVHRTEVILHAAFNRQLKAASRAAAGSASAKR
jgi:hypothetical protein